ncbi:MAG: hypothetical protein ACXVBF_02560 [Flavisolibacter sp.]
MNEDVSKLKLLIEKIYTLSFFERLFGWKKFKAGLVEISISLSNLDNKVQDLELTKDDLKMRLTQINSELQNTIKEQRRLEFSEQRLTQLIAARDVDINRLTADYNTEKTQRENLERQFRETNKDLGELKRRAEQAEIELKERTAENIRLKNEEALRMEEHKKNISTLNELRKQLQKERLEEIEEKHQQELSRREALKKTWRDHQTEVQNQLKVLCNKHTIQYIDKVPFKGEPDNTLYICDEYVVFDAKSPLTDDLSNFPYYLKDQTEKAKKYAKVDDVKTDIFFVVPSNTLQVIKQPVYNLADYNVYIVSLDILEPLILALCKIEEYEFAEQLSPEDRENICRILGKFAHLSKRRIQIDSFFARQFIELAYKCENSLPTEIHDKVLEFERSEKLNPPVEKRAKAINLKELEMDTQKINKEAEAKGIVISNEISSALDDVSLYK